MLPHQSLQAFLPILVWTVDIRKRDQPHQKSKLRKRTRPGRSSRMQNPFLLLSSLEIKIELVIWRPKLLCRSSRDQLPSQVQIFSGIIPMILLTFPQVTLSTVYHSRPNKIYHL
uniref:Uncharacterized protein n=1 Tax=Opuntia streptacantha TaxID=393608 RepID=A0A7C8YWZ0_OPUST